MLVRRDGHAVEIGHTLTVVEEIIAEAIAANSDVSHPLPLLATWDTGDIWDNFDTPTTCVPSWQMTQIAAGHHLLPCFFQPTQKMLDPALAGNGSLIWPDYFQESIETCAALGLPICFVGTQWEASLYDNTQWLNLAYASNPNMAHASTGAVIPAVSAFGATPPWTEVGEYWMSVTNQVSDPSMLSIIQGWYPTPPLVIWVSNNEALRVLWSAGIDPNHHADIDKHYLDVYAAGASMQTKRDRVVAGYTTRYGLMLSAMRSTLSSAWQTPSKFIAYDAFGPSYFGRWYGWNEFSWYTQNQIDPTPVIWDGGSPSYYNRFSGWDDLVASPQYQSTSYPFMQAEALTLNPDFWFELSTWPGTDFDPPGADAESQAILAHSPGYNPTRFAGMVQYGMWVTRPRMVRMFFGQGQALSNNQGYITVQMEVIDKIYTTPTLKTFWRQSDLVANPARAHAFQTDIPTEYASVERSYLLSTNLDPNSGDATAWAGDPWAVTLPVFALARVRGTTPNRQWLVYTQSPNGTNTPTITVPGYGGIAVSSTEGGKFYLCTEGGGVTEVI